MASGLPAPAAEHIAGRKEELLRAVLERLRARGAAEPDPVTTPPDPGPLTSSETAASPSTPVTVTPGPVAVVPKPPLPAGCPEGSAPTLNPNVWVTPTGATWVTPGYAPNNATSEDYDQWRRETFGPFPEIMFVASSYANPNRGGAGLYSPEGIAWFKQTYGREPDPRFNAPPFTTAAGQPGHDPVAVQRAVNAIAAHPPNPPARLAGWR